MTNIDPVSQALGRIEERLREQGVKLSSINTILDGMKEELVRLNDVDKKIKEHIKGKKGRLLSWINLTPPPLKAAITTAAGTLILSLMVALSAYWNVEYGAPTGEEIVRAEQGYTKADAFGDSINVHNFKSYWMGGEN